MKYKPYNEVQSRFYPPAIESLNEYEGNIDTAEIRKPQSDKDWEWKNRFHNFLSQHEVKAIYYKESFSAGNDLSAGSALNYAQYGDTSSNPEPYLFIPKNKKGL